MAEPGSGSHQQPERRAADGSVRGLNIVGFLEAESGVGEVARRVSSSVAGRGIPVALFSHRQTARRQLHAHALALSDTTPFDTNLVCLNAGHLRPFIEEVGAGFFARRYSIGLWFWETDTLRPAESRIARFFDELWVASDYVKAAIEPVVDVPVHVVPVPMHTPRGPFLGREALGLSPAYTFLFVFDFWSEPRKNALAVVEAFTTAFEPGEGPVLVLKSVHGDTKPDELARLSDAAGARGDVVIRDGYISPSEVSSYFAGCDCYVSLHRSEGLGLTMAEAMALGKPVIATGYSGNLQFMNEANSYLVPVELVDVPEGWWGHAPGARWADPDVEAAAALMRQVWQQPDAARRVGAKARTELLERFSPERTSAFVSERLDVAHGSGAVDARGARHDARPAIIDASLELDSDRALSPEDTSGRGPAFLARRLLARATWHHLEHERRLGVAFLDALTSLHRSVDALERRVLELEERVGATESTSRRSSQ